MEPVRFARSGGSKALGCLVYLLLAPVAAFVIALAIGMPLYGIALWLGASEDTASGWGVAGFGLGVILGLWFSYHNWRSRSSIEVLLGDEQMDVVEGSKRIEVSYADVASIRLRKKASCLAVIITTESQQRVTLPPDIASYDIAGDDLHDRIMPHLARRMEECLDRGESVAVRESIVIAYLRMLHGLLRILLVPLLFLSIRFAFHAMDSFRYGKQLLRWGVRGRHGGFAIFREGVQVPSALDPRTVPWEELSDTVIDHDGIYITTMMGEEAFSSPTAENFWPASNLIAAKLGRDVVFRTSNEGQSR